MPDRKGRYTAGKCNQMSWYLRNVIARYGKPTDTFFKATQIGDALGINAFEMIGNIPWMVKCVKEGLLTDEEIGLKMADIGTLEFAEKLCDMIANRKGFGNILAEGAPRAADIIGKGQHLLPHFNRGFAQHWNPWAWSPIALFWATDSRHPQTPIHQLYWTFRMMTKGTYPQSGWLKEKEVAHIAKELFGTTKAIDYSDEGYYDPIHAKTAAWAQDGDIGMKRSTILCDYGPFPIYASWFSGKKKNFIPDTPSPEIEPLMVNAVVGRELIADGKHGMKMGERFWNLERAIMMREGRTRKDDKLADYMHKKKKKGTVTGPEGKTIKIKRTIDRQGFEGLLDAYYKVRGWDVATGRPTRKKLEELDLKDVADELGKDGLLPNA
jgi:aldehyde:ferredoxin oxidoreductase